MNYIVLLIIFVLAFFLGTRFRKDVSPKEEEVLKNMRDKAHKAVSERTDDRKDKIIKYMEQELRHKRELEDCKPGSTEEGIKRSDVEDLLGVSSQTALNYLNELEEENKITQVGESGQNVRYTLNTIK